MVVDKLGAEVAFAPVAVNTFALISNAAMTNVRIAQDLL
jgi:hypothetical protein